MKRKAPGAGRANPIARALRSRLFQQRRVKPLKGKAAYTRRPKHRGGGFFSPGLAHKKKAEPLDATRPSQNRFRRVLLNRSAHLDLC